MGALSIYSAISQPSNVPRGYFIWSILLGLMAIIGAIIFVITGYTRR